ncbi:hypothetical protein [Nodularia sp. UHCC 0506]|nr:hypothetical protein [Nodularia sp. UHCC 0506]MEA5512761.1 hypothetical protein [Nodularia sp. UHCC 0506]
MTAKCWGKFRKCRKIAIQNEAIAYYSYSSDRSWEIIKITAVIW